MKVLKLIMICSTLMLYACKDAFEPEVSAKYKDLLVVEGFINIGGKTIIKLSRTGDLQDSQYFIPEKSGEVIIEGDQGTLIKGTTDENGACLLSTENLILVERYKLKLIDNKGKTYETDFLEAKISPEIDSLNFKVENTGFQIYVNTHDDMGKTRYYNWTYTETWEIRSALFSYFDYKNGQVVERNKNENITSCWKSNQSSNILLNTTERLSQDKLALAPLNYIAGNSEKLGFMYSILVNQYGLTREAYQYLENIRKNTEKIGGIFDSQPSELKGNVTCISNPDETVLGWISAGKISEKRLFISALEKPSGGSWKFLEACEPFRTSKDSLSIYINANNSIVDEIRVGNGVLTGYIMGKTSCIDCRLRGSNIKPTYWPN